MHSDRSVMFKKRKIDRACDSCRRKKTKCDGPKMSDGTCTNCIQAQKNCTYVESSRPRGPSKAYITSMEDRLERLEALLTKLRPDTDFSEELGPPIIRDSWKGIDDRRSSTSSRNSSSLPRSDSSSALQAYPVHKGLPFAHHRVPPPPIHKNPRRKSVRILDEYGEESGSSVYDSSSDEGSTTDDECDRLQSLIQYPSQMADATPAVRYHGKSSQSTLVKVTRQFKELRLLELTSSKEISGEPLFRQEFWSAPPWELVWEGLQSNSQNLLPSLMPGFPPPDLAVNLCDIYFTHVNPSWPLLHRPTFDRQFNDKLHHRDHWFACLCLSLFAVASQWCTDPRVIPEESRSAGSDGEQDWHKAGNQYLEAALDIHRSRRSLINITCLFEVQTFTLLAMCWRTRNLLQLAWLFTGVGLRKAMDIGVHRKRTYPKEPSVEGELWKRAFWLLVAYERIDSFALGRSCILQDEDIDTDLPLEVDDEYWETENTAVTFRQPKSKPAKATAFNLWVHITQIIAYTIRTLYTVNKSKSLFGVATEQRRDEVIAYLNAALSDWLEAVPRHLRWSTQIQDPVFASQSAIIHASYHSTRILVYRTFMPSPETQYPELPQNNLSSHSATSICVDAAKMLAEIIDHQLRRDAMYAHCMAGAAHSAAALLTGHIWWLKRKEKAQHEALQDIKPPLAQIIDEMMGHIAIFTRTLELAAPRMKTAARSLRKIQGSLPDAGVGSSLQTGWSELPRQPPMNTDVSTSTPSPHEANVWQWFTAQSSWPNSSSSQQSRVVSAQQDYSGQRDPLDSSHRVSGAGVVEASTNGLDMRPRQGLISEHHHPRQVPGREHVSIQALKPTDWTSTSYSEWEDYRASNSAAYSVTGSMWDNGGSLYQTPSFSIRRLETPQEHRGIGPYSN